MTTLDLQLTVLLRKLDKAQETVEKAATACDNADTDIRDLGNSTIEELTRDICYAGDKCITAKDYCEDVGSMLAVLKEEALKLNERLTSKAPRKISAGVLEHRYQRVLSVVLQSAGCSIAHVAGTLGVRKETVSTYVSEIRALGYPLELKGSRLWINGGEGLLVEDTRFKLPLPDDETTGEQLTQPQEA